MKFSHIGRIALALVSSLALGLGMTACGGYTIGYVYVLNGPGATNAPGNLISGFKQDNLTGNLVPIVHSPFSSGGSNPVSAAVLPGGRFLYVLNQGSGGTASGDCGTAGGVAVFSIGGDGILNFQQCYASQGNTPVWITTDSSGRYVYVLDQVAPCGATGQPACTTLCPQQATTCGDITAFSVESGTGRLTLLTNQQVKDANGTQLTYFPVGPKPIMMRMLPSNGYIFVADQGDSTVFPYAVNSTTGQLTQTQNSTLATGAQKITSISVSPNGSYLYITDGLGNVLLPYTVGANGALQSLAGGAVKNDPSASNPSYVVVDSTTQFLYMLNQNSTNINNPSSSITAYNIQSNGQLQEMQGSPFASGAGPVCAVEDPSNQYLYVSNYNDKSVTGYIINRTLGSLSTLTRATTFATTSNPSCLVISQYTSA
ncbi:MAG: lactonase family protein [Acidobacteriaceae bacterium]